MQSKHVSCTHSDAVSFSQPQHPSSLRPHQLEKCTRRFFNDRLLMNPTSAAALSVLDKVGKVPRATCYCQSSSRVGQGSTKCKPDSFHFLDPSRAGQGSTKCKPDSFHFLDQSRAGQGSKKCKLDSFSFSKSVKSWTRIDKLQARLLSFYKSVKSWTRIEKLEAGMGSKHNLADDTIGSNLVIRRKHQITEQVTFRQKVLPETESRLQVRTVQLKLCNRINDCAQNSEFCVRFKDITIIMEMLKMALQIPRLNGRASVRDR